MTPPDEVNGQLAAKLYPRLERDDLHQVGDRRFNVLAEKYRLEDADPWRAVGIGNDEEGHHAYLVVERRPWEPSAYACGARCRLRFHEGRYSGSMDISWDPGWTERVWDRADRVGEPWTELEIRAALVAKLEELQARQAERDRQAAERRRIADAAAAVKAGKDRERADAISSAEAARLAELERGQADLDARAARLLEEAG